MTHCLLLTVALTTLTEANQGGQRRLLLSPAALGCRVFGTQQQGLGCRGKPLCSSLFLWVAEESSGMGGGGETVWPAQTTASSSVGSTELSFP